jgi:hypothetical protein
MALFALFIDLLFPAWIAGNARYRLFLVIPAKAGIHLDSNTMDPGFRRRDGLKSLCFVA